jgi:hypothetical protein
MITVRINGGLGNRLFQLAVAEHFAHQTRRTLVLYDGLIEKETIHSKEDYFRTIFRNWTILPGTPRVHDIHSNEFQEPIELISTEPIICLSGCFHRVGYIDIGFIPKLVLPRNTDPRVFIHIRGGDYLLHASHNVNLDKYYERSIKLFPQDTVFLLCTNDIDYARSKQFLVGLRVDVSDQNELDTLSTLSGCMGGICANSTFSWWGAFVQRGRRITVPSRWYNTTSLYSMGYYYDGLTVVQVD